MVRILVIEDNLADVSLMRQILTEHCPISIEMTAVPDCVQALSILRETESFDVIVLDLNLPKISGHEFLRQWKTSTPVVVFSSSSNERDREQALALGARGFVRKPIHYEEYVSAVCEMVKPWAEQKNANTVAPAHY